MKWNKQFNYPKSMRSIINGSRHYAVNQETLPSVTSILAATKSFEDKAAILAWKKRVGHDESEKIKTEASIRGISMHSFLESYLLGQLNMELIEEKNKAIEMAQAIIDFGIHEKLTEIWGAEATLYYPGKYAGTADCIGIYEGCQSIIDFKNATKPKKEEWIDEFYLQVGGYSLAHNKVYDSNITQGVILLCTKDNFFQRFMIDGDRLKDYQNKFLERVEQYYLQKNK